ncbi:MAG: hypothetical protein R2701_07355 [Acidimicrobiales bacterium]
MTDQVCEGCGEALTGGRSVCPACGRLNASGPAAPPAPPAAAAAPSPYAAPAPPTPPPGPQPWGAPQAGPGPAGAAPPQPSYGGYGGYSAYGAYGARPPMAPKPKPSPVGWIVAAAIGVLLVGGGITFAVVAARDAREEEKAAELERRADEADRDRAEADAAEESSSTETGGSVDSQGERYPVEAGGGLSWTMVSEPKSDPTSVPTGDGSSIAATLWIAETDFGRAGDLGLVLDLDGRSYDKQGGLEGILANSNGTALSTPGPIDVGGVEGLMVVARLDQSGTDVIARYAIVEVDDRVLVLASFVEGSDQALGEQGFAELIASVRYE